MHLPHWLNVIFGLSPYACASQAGSIVHDLHTQLSSLQQVLGSEFSKKDSGKLLVVGSSGYEGDAAVMCIAVMMWHEGYTCHEALIRLLHQNARLKVRPEATTHRKFAGPNLVWVWKAVELLAIPLRRRKLTLRF